MLQKTFLDLVNSFWVVTIPAIAIWYTVKHKHAFHCFDQISKKKSKDEFRRNTGFLESEHKIPLTKTF